MERATMVEVRCCCNPGKLLGHMRLPESTASRPGILNVPLKSDVPFRMDGGRMTFLELELAWLGEPAGDAARPSLLNRKLCVKDNGATIEQLRRVGCFVENPASKLF